MPGLITSWDDEPTELPDWPTEEEDIQDTYAAINPQDYSSRDDLAEAIWEENAGALYAYYERAGGDVYPDPYLATIDAIEAAATVLWAIRCQQEAQT